MLYLCYEEGSRFIRWMYSNDLKRRTMVCKPKRMGWGISKIQERRGTSYTREGQARGWSVHTSREVVGADLGCGQTQRSLCPSINVDAGGKCWEWCVSVSVVGWPSSNFPQSARRWSDSAYHDPCSASEVTTRRALQSWGFRFDTEKWFIPQPLRSLESHQPHTCCTSLSARSSNIRRKKKNRLASRLLTQRTCHRGSSPKYPMPTKTVTWKLDRCSDLESCYVPTVDIPPGCRAHWSTIPKISIGLVSSLPGWNKPHRRVSSQCPNCRKGTAPNLTDPSPPMRLNARWLWRHFFCQKNCNNSGKLVTNLLPRPWRETACMDSGLYCTWKAEWTSTLHHEWIE